MRLRINYAFALLLTIAAAFATAPCFGQSGPATEKPLRGELAFGYSYLHSNAPPGGCGCFSLNGGNATFALPIGASRFSVVGDVTVTHSGAVTSAGDSLTLSTFMAGARYRPHFGHSRFQPFGQVLIGLAHASGSLAEGQNPASANAGAAFAGQAGGGVDLHASRRFSIRLVEADYLATEFDNGGNDHQNNVRITTGVVIHFGQ
jgi:outer membrane immunogenic protein